MKVYQIFVDRFSTADIGRDYGLRNRTSTGWMGGNLKGVTGKLEYIRALGFFAVWLTLVFSASAYNGYAVTDFYSIDKHFGSNNSLAELAKKAHRLGMKVILDFVANHVSYRHKFFASALTATVNLFW